MAIDVWRTRPFTSPLGGVVDRMFEEAFTPFYGNWRSTGGTTGFQSLPINIWETDGAYQAALMAPGLDEQSINVTVHQDTLAIEGELKLQVPDGAQTIWQEFGPTKFQRSLRLGAAVEPTQVEATYRNGILLVRMPKAEHARARQVQVQLSEPAGTKKLASG
ncbi:MAG: Hsp20/alpha crystallin family protein [Chloroflexota bacterium]|nr:Hsp20/alpha crystallin family protein [Chloroflexota bacterium]